MSQKGDSTLNALLVIVLIVIVAFGVYFFAVKRPANTDTLQVDVSAPSATTSGTSGQ